MLLINIILYKDVILQRIYFSISDSYKFPNSPSIAVGGDVVLKRYVQPKNTTRRGKRGEEGSCQKVA